MQKLRELLTKHEGRKQFAYTLDGIAHIGIGRNIDANGVLV